MNNETKLDDEKGEPREEYGEGWDFVAGYFEECGFGGNQYTKAFLGDVSRFLHSCIVGICKDAMKLHIDKTHNKKINADKIWGHIVETIPVHFRTKYRYSGENPVEPSLDFMHEYFIIDGIPLKKVSWPDSVTAVRMSVVSTLNYIHFFPHNNIEHVFSDRISMVPCWEHARNHPLFTDKDSKQKKKNLTRKLVQILEQNYPDASIKYNQIDKIKKDFEHVYSGGHALHQGDWQNGWAESWSIFQLATSGRSTFHKWLWNPLDKNYKRFWRS